MSLEKFSKNLTDFVSELNLTFPETPIPEDAFSVVTEELMDTFLNEMEPYIHKVSQYDNNTFVDTKEPVVLLEHLKMTEYWAHNLSSSTRYSIFNYLHVLYILAFHSRRSDDLTAVPDLESDTPSLSEVYLKLVNNIRKSKGNEQCMDEECNNCSSTTANPLESLLGGGGAGGLIGELAEDIARDINIEDLGNPMDLMGMLMGKTDSPAGGNLMNLIKTVGDKVKNKIDSGELDQGQLLNEAQNLMGSLGGAGDSSGGLFGGLDLSSMAKMMSQAMPNMPDEATLQRRMSNNRDVALLERKERLRKKLADRKARELEKNSTDTVHTDGTTRKKRRRRKKKRKEKVEESTN